MDSEVIDNPDQRCFELDLAPGCLLDAHPERVTDTHSWEYMTWLPPHPGEVRPGDRVRVAYDYAAGDGRISLRPS